MLFDREKKGVSKTWNGMDIKYSMEYGKHGMEYKIKYSLIGIGDIRIRPEYKHVFFDTGHFSKLTSNQKEKYFKKLDIFNYVDYKKSLESNEIDLQFALPPFLILVAFFDCF